MLRATSKAFRLHIGFFGRRNVGKSSLLNAVTRQYVSIVSEVAGTTTDPEIGEIGPIGAQAGPASPASLSAKLQKPPSRRGLFYFWRAKNKAGRQAVWS